MSRPSFGIDREVFIREYGRALADGYAAVFVGAGLSVGSGLVDWKGLLRDFADELGLDIEIESDLVTVAQYHLNAAGDDRSRLNAKMVAEFSVPVRPSDAHESLARLPIHTIWTSNYDDLLERSLQAARRQVVTKKSGKDLSVVNAVADALVLKLHGDLSDPSSLIITRDDYARYMRLHPGFRNRLKVDLTEKTFLFLGFSFTDPHLDFILEQLRQERGSSIRPHYAIIRREQSTARARRNVRLAATRQRLKVADLERYGIQTVLVDDHSEVTTLLKRLNDRYHRRFVMVSGAAATPEPRPDGWLEELGFKLGRSLAREDLKIVSGLGIGVGRSVISGALDVLYRGSDPRIQDRLILWPFHMRRNAKRDRLQRELMVATAGFAIFISGNRRGRTGRIESSPGVFEEFELARAAGAYPLPIGSTGWAASELWTKVNAEFGAIFPRGTPRRAFRVLNAPNASADEVVSALLHLIRHLQPH